MVEFHQFSFWLLTGSLGVLALGAIKFMHELLLEIRKVRGEIIKLSEKLSTMSVTYEFLKKDIDKLDTRILSIEKKFIQRMLIEKTE